MISQAWYQRRAWLKLLRPLSALFCVVARKRRQAYLDGRKLSWKAPVPVLTVGNLSVGGVGKTPLTATLAKLLAQQGLKVGIVSRGYGSQCKTFPCLVEKNSDPKEVGDEPLMLKRLTDCPLVIDPDRPSAVRYLLSHAQVDIIISDDGLQHYALCRDLEIAVIDGERGLGNEHCLPEGPLREPVERLDQVDWVISNGPLESTIGWAGEIHAMQIQPLCWINLKSGETRALDYNWRQPLLAVAGIGNPRRFFSTLKALGLDFEERIFPDHHPFRPADLEHAGPKQIIMTEKDAVKCQSFADETCWYLSIEARLSDDLRADIISRIQTLLTNTDSENR